MSSAATHVDPSCTVESAAHAHADDWDAFVRHQPGTSPYHLWAWRGIFEDVFRHQCEYLAARRDGRIVGVLPLVKFRSRLFGRSLVSLPFVSYGGVASSDRHAAEALLATAAELATAFGARHVELRHVSRRYPDLPCLQHKVSMHLRLPASADQLWGHLDRKVRNQVRKAERSELTAIEGGPELVPEFYEVFAHNMRDLGTPVYDRRLFEQVLARFGASARVFVVRAGRRPAAAGIAYRFRDTVEVPWASSLRQYRSHCANVLLYWRMLSAAIVAGCDAFDFGRSTPGQGTYHFKKQWGATPTPLCWEYAGLHGSPVPDQGPTNPRFAPAVGIWKRLPLAVTNRLGPPIVRNIP